MALLVLTVPKPTVLLLATEYGNTRKGCTASRDHADVVSDAGASRTSKCKWAKSLALLAPVCPISWPLVTVVPAGTTQSRTCK